MPQRESIPAGAPCWADLATSDAEHATQFYADLFGWRSETAGEEYGNYIQFYKDDHLVGGGMQIKPGSGIPDMWSVYLATEDTRATVASAAAHGGQVMVEPMDIGDMGTMAFVIGPDGVPVGTWQPGTHKGFGVIGEPGAPAWFDLQTRDYDTAVAFYRDVFGWDTHVLSDTDELRYTTLGEGDDAQAGIMDSAAVMPEGVPGAWQIYFAVEDVDATAERATELGGTVAQPPWDTAYGRMAALADPNGAVFMVVGQS